MWHRERAGRPLVRRAVLASAGIALAALAGLALPVLTGGPAAATTVVLDPTDGDRHSHDPDCHGRPPCPSGHPTPAPTPSVPDPAPSPTPTDGTPAPAGSSTGAGAPGPGGQSGPAGQPGQPGQPGGAAAGSGSSVDGTSVSQVPAGAVTSDGAAQGATGAGTGSGGRAGPTSLVSAARPFWPFLWGGTVVIALITSGLLLTLRDRPDRPVATASLDSVATSDQAVVSPRGPTRMESTDPPG